MARCLTLVLLFQSILLTSSMIEDSDEETEEERSSLLSSSTPRASHDSVNSFTFSAGMTPRASHNLDVVYDYDAAADLEDSRSRGSWGFSSVSDGEMCQKQWACLDKQFQCVGSNKHECEFSWKGEATSKPIEIKINSVEIEISSGHVIQKDTGWNIFQGNTVEEVTLPSPRLSKIEVQCVNKQGHKSFANPVRFTLEPDEIAPPYVGVRASINNITNSHVITRKPNTNHRTQVTRCCESERTRTRHCQDIYVEYWSEYQLVDARNAS